MHSSASTQIRDLLVVHHSHMDIGYTHSQPVFWQLQSEFIDQALDWLEETADLPEGARPKWTCEANEPVRRWRTGRVWSVCSTGSRKSSGCSARKSRWPASMMSPACHGRWPTFC